MKKKTMARKYYVISDGYYREEYPMNTNLDIEKLYSVQRIEQETTLYDFLGDNLADYLLETILPKDAGDMETWESTFLSKMQKLMVFLVAKALEDYSSTNTNDNKVNALESKIGYYKAKIRAYIQDTDELVAIQDEDDEPDREDYQGLPTYFYR